MACHTCLPDTHLPAIEGCLDKIGAQCITYSADQSVAQILDSLTNSGQLWQTLLLYLQQNPAVKSQLKTLLA